jgi:hypothetical protein
MPKLLTKIDLVMGIQGRGTVLCLPKEENWAIPRNEKVYRNELIFVRTPDGGTISTRIKDIELINRGIEKGSIAFCLPAGIQSDEIPVGSEIWLVRDGAEPVFES